MLATERAVRLRPTFRYEEWRRCNACLRGPLRLLQTALLILPPALHSRVVARGIAGSSSAEGDVLIPIRSIRRGIQFIILVVLRALNRGLQGEPVLGELVQMHSGRYGHSSRHGSPFAFCDGGCIGLHICFPSAVDELRECPGCGEYEH